MHRDGSSANRPARSMEGPRTLRENLAVLSPPGTAGNRRERLQFRSLKRLHLPRTDSSPRLAPNR
jgi:hypothetical protein